MFSPNLIPCCFQLMAQQQQYAQFLFQLADLGSSLNVPALRDEAHAVLKLMPPGKCHHPS